VTERLGHELAARAEQAKIDVADGGDARIDLSHVESRLAVTLSEREAVQAIDADIERIVDAARVTASQAGLRPQQIDALYFTGGSTGLRLLAQKIAAAFPAARAVRGDRFASVATGRAAPLRSRVISDGADAHACVVRASRQQSQRRAG